MSKSPLFHSLLENLYKLNKILSSTKTGTSSILEKYDYFSKHSSHGPNCTYALKCIDLFKKNDYSDIKDLVLEILKNIRSIEGGSFGKQ